MPRSRSSPVIWLREAITSPGVGGILVRGASAALAIRATGLAIAFGVQVLLARLLGAPEYGVYAYALSWLNLLVLASAFGFDSASLRFVPQYRTAGRERSLSAFLRTGRRVVTIGSVTLAVLGVIVVYLFREELGPQKALTFWLACLTLPWIAQVQLGSAVLRGLRKIVASQVPVELVRPLMVGIVVVVYGYGMRSPDAPIAMGATLLANVGAMGLLAWWLRTEIRSLAPHDPRSSRQRRDWIRISLTLLGLTGFSQLLSQTDILMLGALVDTTQAGIYSAATRLARLVTFGLVAVNAIAAPMISDLYSSDRMRELRRLLRLAAWCVLGFAVPAGLFLGVFGRTMLGLFGSEFESAYLPLVILLLGQLIGGLAGSVGYLMTMTGHEVQAAKILGCTAVLNVGLNAWLIPQWGLAGAATATVLSTAAWNVAMVVYCQRRLDLNPTVVASYPH